MSPFCPSFPSETTCLSPLAKRESSNDEYAWRHRICRFASRLELIQFFNTKDLNVSTSSWLTGSSGLRLGLAGSSGCLAPLPAGLLTLVLNLQVSAFGSSLSGSSGWFLGVACWLMFSFLVAICHLSWVWLLPQLYCSAVQLVSFLALVINNSVVYFNGFTFAEAIVVSLGLHWFARKLAALVLLVLPSWVVEVDW